MPLTSHLAPPGVACEALMVPETTLLLLLHTSSIPRIPPAERSICSWGSCTTGNHVYIVH
jgi:hypothetical protein